jgi:DNA invertase Pin-like site-specific DNA recombinase
MAEGNSTPERAGLYYRMSDDHQEHSIERQQSQVRPYALAKGYKVVREYQDEGIPGDEVARRPQFRRLLADAVAGHIDVILCDDVDRFGRFDPIKYGAVVDPIREAGVRLETVAQGAIDWGDTLSVLNDTMRMAFKREQSRDTARRILTKFLVMAERGEWIGKTPYGYRKDPLTKRLVIDPREGEVVRWLFHTYATRDVGLGWLVDELRRRGVKAPRGGAVWQTNTIRQLFLNRNYLGDFHWGLKPGGKYYRFGGAGKAEKSKRKKGHKTPEAEWLVVPDTHPALVDRDTFNRVRAKLAENQKHTTPQKGGGDWLLSKLMVCSHCQHYMVGIGGARERRYRCGGYQLHGGRFCHHHVIRERPVLDALVNRLQADLLNPDNLERLRKEIRRQATAGRSDAEAQARNLRARVAELGRQIDRGNENLALLPRDRIPGVVAKLRAWEAERDRLAAEAEALERGPDVASLERSIDAAEALLWRLRDALTSAEPAAVRAVLRELVTRIELAWEPRPKKSNPAKTTYVFSRGLIYLRVDDDVSKLVTSATAAS